MCCQKENWETCQWKYWKPMGRNCCRKVKFLKLVSPNFSTIQILYWKFSLAKDIKTTLKVPFLTKVEYHRLATLITRTYTCMWFPSICKLNFWLALLYCNSGWKLLPWLEVLSLVIWDKKQLLNCDDFPVSPSIYLTQIPVSQMHLTNGRSFC